MTTSTQQGNSLTDYDKEWDLEDGNTNNPKTLVADEDETLKTEATDTTSEAPAPFAQPEASQDNVDSKVVEPEATDIFAGMTAAQRDAYKKAERDGKAMAGRHRLSQDRISQLEQKLLDQQKVTAELTEKTRVPSEFEKEHPEYYQQLKSEFQSSSPEPSTDSNSQDSSSYTEADLIIAAHPEAGEWYSSTEFKSWLSTQPASSTKDIEAPYASQVLPVLDAYNSHLASLSTSSLQGIADVGGSSARPNITRTTDMSTTAQYDAEWENED